MTARQPSTTRIEKARDHSSRDTQIDVLEYELSNEAESGTVYITKKRR